MNRGEAGSRALAGIELPPTADLSRELADLLRQVPRGQVTTYGDLAEALGDRAAARWVGSWMREHPHDAACACHRVVRSTGEPGLYLGGDPKTRLALLRKEGAAVGSERVDLASRFNGLESTAPLRALSDFQTEVPGHLRLSPLKRRPTLVAGIDVAYPRPEVGVVAYVLVDAESLETLWERTLELPVAFPYVSGYLTFRELPLMLEAWRDAREAGRAADAVLIDGNGYLHPRRAGIACCFGLMADVPTIGIGKSLLCGRVDLNGMSAAERRPITDGDELIGVALKSRNHSRAVFVSPGNRIDFEGAVDVARAMMREHRLPEPIHRADRLSKRAA